MDAYSALSLEIDRVTSCPYPTQLRTLHTLATTQCSDADISRWAAAKPCLVPALASALLEGLRHWPYVVDLVAKFALDGTCRDALLQQEPTLLHNFVAQTREGRFVAASVALLSRRLPGTVALPAEVQSLFVQLVDEAARRPCSATIQPVYRLLSGTGSLLLGILGLDAATKFEEQLLEILKNGPGSDDPGLGLYCLSIMNVVCCSMDPEFRLTASSYRSEDFLASTPVGTRWKAEAMQQFFTGSKAQRSLHLLSLVTIWAINKSSLEACGEKIRCLVSVNEVVTAIPSDLRKNWCVANPVMMRKLQEKLCAEGLDETIKTLALRFMGKLCDLDSLPHPVLESIEMTFLEPKGVQTAHTLCPHVDDCELFANVLARAPVSVLLRNSVDYAVRGDSVDLASGLSAVTRMLKDALTIIEEQKITGHEIRATLNDPTFTQALQCLKDLVEQAPDQHAAPQTLGWCKKALHRMRSNLAHQISDLLLRVCHSSSMDPNSMTLLLSLHASSARGDLQCSHERPLWRDHLDVANPVDENVPDQMDWREALHTHFKARAQVEQDAVTRLFAKACASLEARCENVEKPLREEREKRRTAEKQSEELNQALAQLEAQNMDHLLRARDLEAERDAQLQNLDDRHDEMEGLMSRIAELEEKLKETQAQGEKQLAELRDAKKISELDAASAMAKKQEEFDDLQDEYEKAMRSVEAKEQEKISLDKELAGARSECERLDGEVIASHARVGELQGHVRELEHKNGALETANGRLQEQLSSANNHLANGSQEVSELTRQLQELQTERDELKASLTRENELLHALRDEHTQIERLAKEQQDTIKMLEDQNAAYQQEIQSNRDQNSTDLATRDTKIHELQDKIDRLKRKCEQKDHQITAAEAMRSNLMAAMGLSSTQTRALAHRPREDSSLPQTQQDADPTPPTPTSENLQPDDQSFSSQESNHRAGPTPKRPRPRRSIAPPSTSLKTRASMGTALGGKGTQWAEKRRQTLGVVSGNGNRGAMTGKTPKKVQMEVGVGDGDETTFDGSEIFAGTQGGMLGLE